MLAWDLLIDAATRLGCRENDFDFESVRLHGNPSDEFSENRRRAMSDSSPVVATTRSIS